MPITKASLKSSIHSFLSDLAGQVATSALKGVPLVGDLALPVGQAVFGPLIALIDSTIDAAGPDTADLVEALNSIDGVTAKMDGDDLAIDLSESQSLSLVDKAFDAGASAGGIGLKLDGTFGTSLSASLNAKLKLDGTTGELSIVDPGNTRELTLQLQSNLSLNADGDLGILNIDVHDKDPAAPELNLSASFDLPAGKAADVFDAPLSPTFTGTAGLDLKVETKVADGLLPSISTELLLDYDLITGNPQIAFKDVSLDIGSFLGVFGDVFKELYDKLDSFPLGVILDIATGPLPIIDDFAHSLHLTDTLDKVPQIRDHHISLADLAVLYDKFTGAGIGTFFEGLSTIDLIRDIAQSLAIGKLNLGDFSVSANPADSINAFVGLLPDEAKSLFDDVLKSSKIADNFTSKGGLKIPLLDDPSLIVKLLLNSVFPDPVPLVEFDLPDLTFENHTDIDFPILGPLGLTLEGDAKVGIDLGIGYDTKALQTHDFKDGLFFTNFDDKGNPSVAAPVAYLQTRIGAGVELNAVVFRASATGGIGFGIDAYLHDDDGDGRMRLSEAGSCFFDPLEGKAVADVRVKLKIGFGPFSYTKTIPIASVVLVDFSFGCPPPASPVDHGLATLTDGNLILNTGPRAPIRVINEVAGNDATDIEGYKIGLAVDPKTGAVIAGALAISAFGSTQTFGAPGAGPLIITGDLGQRDDSLMVSADVTQAVEVHGGDGNDLIVGGAGADKLFGDNDADYLVGNAGDDDLEGGDGDDALVGGAGADTLAGGAGIDEVSYADAPSAVRLLKIAGVDGIVGFGGEAQGDRLSGIDHLTGTNYGDTIMADDEVDGFGFAGRVLEGLAGNDVLVGATGNDFLLGGAGGDLLLGGSGRDGTSYLTSFGAVSINLAARIYYGGDATGDWLDSIEEVYGSGADDTLVGDESGNTLDGFFGDDTLDGGGGADTVAGGLGDDVVYGRTDGDMLDGGGFINDPGTDLLSYRKLTASAVAADLSGRVASSAVGTDNLAQAQYFDELTGLSIVVPGYSTFENLEGTDLAAAGDSLTGDNGDNVIWGLAGDDTVNAGYGFDRLIGGLGADRLDGGAGIDWAEYRDSAEGVTAYLDGTAGVGGTAAGDVITNVENLLGSDQTDDLYGDANSNIVDPGLTGTSRYYDFVDGGGGTDILRLDYSRGDYGQGFNGGYFTGAQANSAGYGERRDVSGNVILDAVAFTGIEALRVTGTHAADIVFGGSGNDVIVTGSGNDTVYGGIGFDYIDAGDDDDFVIYGTDDRALTQSVSGGNYLLDGGRGIDTLSVSLASERADIVLSGSATAFAGVNLALGGGPTIERFEILKDVWTGSGDDNLTQLGRYDNDFRTADGSDTIRPGLGFDTVDGGIDLTGLSYSDGPNYYDIDDVAAFAAARGDTLILDYASLTDAAVDSSDDVDSPEIRTTRGINTKNVGVYRTVSTSGDGTVTNSVSFKDIERLDVTGSGFDDLLVGTSVDYAPSSDALYDVARGDDTLRGLGGNDLLLGYSGNDVLDGGDGDDELQGSQYAGGRNFQDEDSKTHDFLEVDDLTGGAGSDTFVLGDAIESHYLQSRNERDSSVDNHAVIEDFNVGENDVLRLHGNAQIYETREHDGVTDIFETDGLNAEDLIATLKGVSDFNLTASYVAYLDGNQMAAPAGTDAHKAGVSQGPAAPAATNQAASTSGPAQAPAPAEAASWVAQQADPDVLLSALGLGSGVVSGSQSLTIEGSGEGFGTFQDDPFGLGQGIVLSTGRVVDLAGPNTSDGPAGPPSVTLPLQFTFIGRSGNSDIYRANLSNLGININSLRFADGNTRTGGGGGIASGFDIDSFALSTTDLGSVASDTDLNNAAVLPRLDVLAFDNAHLFYTPGTQRAPSNGFDYGPDLRGSINGYPGSGNALVETPARKLSTFSLDGDSLTLGDGGSLGVNLSRTLSTDGPLYLYIGEEGGTGEALIGSVTASSDQIEPTGDLSTDLGAPGLAGDTSRMTYSFTPVDGTDLVSFQVVLFSEELPEHAGIADPDALTVTLNGVSIASLSDGAAADLNTLMNSPYYASHPDLILNPAGTGPLADQVAADAYTKTLTFVGRVQAGVQNTLVVQVADARDAYLDTGVLIKGGAFLASGGALATNIAPFAVGDVANVAFNTAYAGSVLGNDVDPNGDALTASLVAGPQNGTVRFSADGTFTYTPKAAFFGDDSFTYRASDGTASSDPATVTLLVARPTGVVADPDGPYATLEDTPLSVDAASGVLAGDSASSGASLSARLITTTQHGTLQLNADGSFSYTPAVNFNGADSFVYRASDGTTTSGNRTVTITTAPINDAPTLSLGAPSARLIETGVKPDGSAVPGTSTATIQLTKGDPDAGNVTTYDTTDWTAAGSGRFSKTGTYGSVVLTTATGVLTYTLDNARAATNALAAGVMVADPFTVTVKDAAGALVTRTASFGVTGTNDAPLLGVGAQSLKLVEAGIAANGTGILGTSVATIALTKSDPDTGNVASFDTAGWTAAGAGKLSKLGTYGSVVLDTASGILTYTLDNAKTATKALTAGASATDSFAVTVKDAAGASVTRTVGFAVTGSNDTPTLTVGAPSRTLVEAGTGVPGIATATIAVTKADADAGSVPSFVLTGWTAVGNGKFSRNGTYGSVVFDTGSGILTYTLDNGRAATNDLENGDVRTEGFAITVKDASGASITRTAAFTIKGSGDGVTINGSAGPDVVSATSTAPGQPLPTRYADTINGNGDDDVISGLGGKDVVDGGQGSDTASYAEKTAAVVVKLNGATAATVTIGGVAEDTIRNIENLIGGSAGDGFTGDASDNVFSGRDGKDVLDGAGGLDTASYAEKTAAVAVTLNGATAATVTVGGAAEDTVRNIENLIGGSGADKFTGDGLANVFSGRGGKDVLDGGGGLDTADYAEKTASVAVTLNGATAATVTVGGVAEDTVRNIENIIGGSGNDTLTGDGSANVLTGNAGNDVLKGVGGKDALDGGTGTDTADYSEKTTAVVVALNGATAATVTVGGAAEDTVRNIENLIGGSSGDGFTGDGFANTFSGRGGKDVLDGGGGLDTADYAEKTASVAVTLSGATAATVSVGGAAEDTVKNIENLIGGSAADRFTGDGFANTFSGRGGKDVLDGAGGIDTASYAEKNTAVAVTLNGSTVATVTVGGAAEDTVRNIENLIGGSAADTFTGDGFANTFSGRGGKDVLDGGGGLDTADYAEKTAAVAVTLNGATTAAVTVGGVAEDTVRNIENIVGGSANDTLTGDGSANALTGNAGDDVLTGAGGKDTLDGGLGSDTASYLEKTAAVVVTLNGSTAVTATVGGAAEDTIRNIENLIGGSAADTFTGDALANILSGRGGKDVLDGGGGIDTADYAEKTASVAVTLNGATAATVTVGGVAEDTLKNIENVVGGSAGDTLTGDALANVLTGNGGNDVLRGGAGRDVLDGGAGSDTADYADKAVSVAATLNGAAAATVTVGGIAEDSIRNIENLAGGSAADTFTGDGLGNVLSGNGGDDILKGLGGSDTLNGGTGSDTADYSDKTASVAATLNGATPTSVKIGGAAEDTILNIENLIGGSAADLLSGDGLANALYGNAGNDRLDGGGGGDSLFGGLGNDTLAGGAGLDAFVFTADLNAASNVDTILDFNVADDTIQLSRSVFAALGLGPVQTADFTIGTAATTSAQNLIYTQSSGKLYYDKDGAGGAAQVQFASLGPNLALTAADFRVV